MLYDISVWYDYERVVQTNKRAVWNKHAEWAWNHHIFLIKHDIILSNKRVVIRNISIVQISNLRCLFDTWSTGVCDPDGTPLTEKSSTQVVVVQVVEL